MTNINISNCVLVIDYCLRMSQAVNVYLRICTCAFDFKKLHVNNWKMYSITDSLFDCAKLIAAYTE